MKIVIAVHDDSGRVFEGEAILTPAKPAKRPAPKLTADAKIPLRAAQSVDFDLPPRAFMKRRAGDALAINPDSDALPGAENRRAVAATSGRQGI